MSIFITSCLSDSACKSSRTVRLNLKLETIYLHKERDTALKSLIVYGIGSDYNLPADSGSTALAGFSLPLNPTNDTSRYVFITGAGTDTLSLVYGRELFFISSECGFITRFHLHKIMMEGSAADSATIVNPLVSTDGFTNIKIYY